VLRPSPVAARDAIADRAPRHEAVLYTTRGYKAGYQRVCPICAKDTSYFCSACGKDCPIHPHKSRKGTAYACLDTHLGDPAFRTRKTRANQS
jgi:hypothetical protein